MLIVNYFGISNTRINRNHGEEVRKDVVVIIISTQIKYMILTNRVIPIDVSLCIRMMINFSLGYLTHFYLERKIKKYCNLNNTNLYVTIIENKHYKI